MTGPSASVTGGGPADGRAVFDAAQRWFASSAIASARRLMRGEITEADLARAFAGFGLAEMLAEEASPAERAAIIGDVALAAGRQLYVGPLLETTLDAVLGAITTADGRPIDELPTGACTIARPIPAGRDDLTTVALPHAACLNAAIIVGPSPWWCPVPAGIASEQQVDGTTLAILTVDPREPSPPQRAVPDVLVTELEDLSILSDAARLIGIAERVAELSNAQLSIRHQFGRALASFQALQHRAVDRHLANTLSRALLDQTVRCWEDAATRRAALPALKVVAADAAVDGAEHAVQMFGAMGFTDECEVGLYLRHALVVAARRGNAADHRRTLADVEVAFLS
ncbi:MAG: acyl-CoA dehydrogenase family protein [Lautropia sp.]